MENRAGQSTESLADDADLDPSINQLHNARIIFRKFNLEKHLNFKVKTVHSNLEARLEFTYHRQKKRKSGWGHLTFRKSNGKLAASTLKGQVVFFVS